MTEPWNIPDPGPTPEQLAAYADGELEPRARAQVEAWLADRPEAAAEVEALHGLKRLWQAQAAPEPAPEAWDRTLARIESRLPAAAARGRSRWRPWAWVLTAAAAALVVVLARPLWSPVVPPGGDIEEVPFPVADNSEVVILSMDGNDVASLVVGHPPVQGEIVLASHDEVELLDTGDWDMPRPERGVAPMVIDPLAIAGLR
jgi:anti-sigma factor ChrR (cupin superfamily)